MRRYLDAAVRELSHGWQFSLGSATKSEARAETRNWRATPVPSTLAAQLSGSGEAESAESRAFHDHTEAWYRCHLTEPAGTAVLRFAGLATIADVFLNDELILRNESMFEAHDVAVELTGDDELMIHFESLNQALSAKAKRAKWRPALIDEQRLRLVRTTLLGHMPGWCPSIQAVGPYRPISLIRPGQVSLGEVQISAELSDRGDGLLTVSCSDAPPGLSISCDGMSAHLTTDGERQSATLRIPQVEPWWPATHGTPKLYDIEVSQGTNTWKLGRTGFRSLRIDRGSGDDFAVIVNGIGIFCRGAVWTNADLAGLSADRETYAPLLRQLAAAGANMVRIPGIATYETTAFFDLCDELGLLVFQDFMFANFDYPQTESFTEHVRTEVRQFLLARQGCPSLAVLTAGSEIAQQAAMLGLAEQYWYSHLATEVLPSLVAELRPDVGYVPGSPSGGPLPFSVNAGISHYYGVGAYERDLTDARRAQVRFTSECLAFANVPAATNLPPGLDASPVHDPAWKAGVPRDPGASWDFEDTRDHYLGQLYAVDPATLRRGDPQAYLDYSRAVTAEVATETFAEWRSTDSTCNGALVFTLSDLRAGAGWGVLDSDHHPKSILHALARAWRPITVVFTDEGMDGLRLHAINETAVEISATVELFGLRDGTIAVSKASHEIALPPRSTTALNATDLLGGFFDFNYAYRFGPASHQVVVAQLSVDGRVVGEAFSFPTGRSAAIYPAEVHGEVVQTADGWSLALSTDTFAQSVQLITPGFLPDDNWFHLIPGVVKLIGLQPLPGTDTGVRPTGELCSLGGSTAGF
jgi:beta-mannosidase